MKKYTEQERSDAAYNQYQSYYFGDGVEASDHQGWERLEPGDEWTRMVYVQSEDSTTKLAFTVVFETGSALVAESYAIDFKGCIWGTPVLFSCEASLEKD